jgi:hypothetical protein
MTPLETLQKYGLKTDVKSIRERTGKSYSDLLVKFITEQKEPQSMLGINYDSAFRHRWEEIKNADLALLCELAEKGERLEKVVKDSRSAYQEQANISGGLKKVEYNIAVAVLDEIITEAEGE